MIHRIGKTLSPEQAALRDDFWRASSDSLFSRKSVAAALSMSVSWLEKLATRGGGPRYVALGKRKSLYRKGDVEAWYNQLHLRTSTSEALPSGVAA